MAADLPPLYTDESKVSQILRNFLSNALKSTAQGEIRVTAQVSADQQARIFAVEASGMGLAIVKKTVEHRGSTVWVDSVLGQGATFAFTWPIETPIV